MESGRTAFHETRYLAALEHYRTALAEAERSNISAELRGKILTSIGACLLGLSDYKAAVAQFLQARPYTVEGGNREHLAALDANVASAYLYQGDRDNAARIYRRALGWLKGDAESVSRPLILANLGVIELLERRYRSALGYEEAALRALDETADRERQAAIHDLVGLSYLGLRDYARARGSFERSLELRRTRGPAADLTRSLMFLGRAEWEKGNPAAAIKTLDQAIANASRRDNRVALWAALYLRGQCYRQLSRTDMAAKDFQESVGVLESIRTNLLPTDSLRVQFEVSHHEVYAALADLLCETHFAEGRGGGAGQAFYAVELGRAHSLRALVRSRPGGSEDGEPTTWMRYADRLARLEATRARSLAARDVDAPRLLRQLGEQEGELREFEARMRVEEPVLSGAIFAPASSLTETQAALGADELLLNFYTGDKASYLWAVTDAEARFYRLPPAAKWRPLLSRFLSALQEHRDNEDHGRRLYEALLGHVDPELLERRHWIVAAGGELGLLPFCALPSKSGRYLVEEHSFTQTPSVSVLHSLESRNIANYERDFLGVADPVVNRADPRAPSAGAALDPPGQLARLVASETEVRACARLFPPGRWTVLAGPSASESQLRRQAPQNYRFWHITSHVVVDAQRPNHSFIALTIPDRLTVLDVLGLPVRAEMVVLNGCDSGTGKTLPGTGVLGLARAFLASGAQSVLATRWAVPDESGALVRRLYAHLLSGGSFHRAEALRQAQIEMIRQRDWRSEPRYWAAYFLVGSPGRPAGGPGLKTLTDARAVP